MSPPATAAPLAPRERAWPFLLGTGILLGLGGPLSKAAAAEGVQALSFALWPTLLAAALLALLARRRHGPMRLTADRVRFGFIAGLLGHALPMTALFWLSAQAGAGFAALAFTLPPVCTLLASLLVGLERFSWTRVLAVGLGLAGAALLVAPGGGEHRASAGAVLLVLAIPTLIGSGNVYRALRTPAGTGAEWLAALTLGSSSIVLAIVAAVSGLLAPPPGPAALGWLAAQTLALVGGYALYFELQRRADPVTFSFMGYVMMLTGVAAGVGFMGERLSASVYPALALILAGFYTLHRAGPG